MSEIVRGQDEIDRVLNWAVDGLHAGTRYAGMSYEQGILDMHDWLVGDSDQPPDED
jgi:hypothetical protein